MVGQTVGKYRVVSRLGRGGMGTVYKAVDETLDREVAIKSLNTDLSDPEPLKRFRAEAITLAKLNHPNIAMVFELTEHEGELLMVMEFVRGETFEALSQRSGPMPVDRCRELCTQVLDALKHAHGSGIVHRDLKPANLMLTDSGVVKVMDFGLARMVGTEHLTTDGFMVGTPAYMAPEQVLAEEIDGRADLYAMGVVLYRLLTSQLPFKADSGIAMAHMQVHDAPTPLRTRRTELSPACETIISRALAKAPADRFQTADEFKTALALLDVMDPNLTIAAPTPMPTMSSVSAASSGVKAVSATPSAATPSATARSAATPSAATRSAAASSAAAPSATAPSVAAPSAAGLSAADLPTVYQKTSARKVPLAGIIAAVLLVAVPATAFLVWRSRAEAKASPAPSDAAAPASAAPAPAPNVSAAGAAPSPSASVAPPPTVPAAPPPSTPAAEVPGAATAPPAGATSAPPPSRTAAPASTGARVSSGASSRGASSSATARASAPSPPALKTVTFSQIKLLQLDADKPHDRDVSVTLGADTLDVLDGTTLVARVRYHDVIGLHQSHSREPRYTTAAGTTVPLAKVGGHFGFLKGGSDWVSVQTKATFVSLHVPESELARLVSELESRTGARIVHAR